MDEAKGGRFSLGSLVVRSVRNEPWKKRIIKLEQDILINVFITKVIIMTIRQLSRKVNLPYSTTRKYLKSLEEAGYITLRITEHGARIDHHTLVIFEELVELIKSGYPLQKALERLGEGRTATESRILEYLSRLEKKVEDLEAENRKLNELLQVYISKVERALPSGKEEKEKNKTFGSFLGFLRFFLPRKSSS